MDASATHDLDGAIGRIGAALGAGGWTTDPEALAPLLTEQRGHLTGRAAGLARPRTTEEVAAVVRICNETRVPVVPQGGNTGLVAAGTPDETGGAVLLSLSRLDRIREVDPADFTMTVEAGCILADIQEAARRADRLFPLSLGAEGSCQIGGNLSTNAGGVAVLRYGNTRELVLGLEVVLPDGTVWDGLRRLRKDNTGYDLKQLFIGAEGTLGVITAAVLRLFPLPRERATAFVAVRDLDAVIALLARARAESGDMVTAFEYMARIGIELGARHVPGVGDPLEEAHPHYALVEFTSAARESGLEERMERFLAAALEEGLVTDAAIAQNEAQARAFWRIRESIPEAQTQEGASIKHDVAVPVSRVPEFIARAGTAVEEAMPGIRPVPFGHAGDGNIHFNLTQPAGMEPAAFLDRREAMNRIVHDIVADMDGSISAEHGIGSVKREELRRYAAPVKLDLMRRLKTTLDPNGIMNPGKVV